MNNIINYYNSYYLIMKNCKRKNDRSNYININIVETRDLNRTEYFGYFFFFDYNIIESEQLKRLTISYNTCKNKRWQAERNLILDTKLLFVAVGRAQFGTYIRVRCEKPLGVYYIFTRHTNKYKIYMKRLSE